MACIFFAKEKARILNSSCEMLDGLLVFNFKLLFFKNATLNILLQSGANKLLRAALLNIALAAYSLLETDSANVKRKFCAVAFTPKQIISEEKYFAYSNSNLAISVLKSVTESLQK